MSELKWNWVYYPYLDAPNKQEESAMKAGYIKVVIKDEADKVIAEKDKEIAELKAQKAQADDDCAYWKMSEGNAVTAMHETEEYAMQLYNELRHQKFKRCLAMAKWCEERCARYDLLQEHSGFSWRREIDFYFRWYQRWLELAKKFKEAK